MKSFPTSQEDFHELALQVGDGYCYNTHCLIHEPQPLTHWWAIDLDDEEISIVFNACCKRCASSNIRTVDGFKIKNVGKLSELPSLELRNITSSSPTEPEKVLSPIQLPCQEIKEVTNPNSLGLDFDRLFPPLPPPV